MQNNATYHVGKPGTIHLPGCTRMGETIPIDYLPEIGEVIIIGRDTKEVPIQSHTRADGKKVRATVSKRSYDRFIKVRIYCHGCFGNKNRLVPLGKRYCHGPLHPQGKLLPISEFHGGIKLSRRCRDCIGFLKYGNGNSHGFIVKEKVVPYLEEIVAAHGNKEEAARRIGISADSINRIMSRNKYVLKPTVKKILEEAYRLKKAA